MCAPGGKRFVRYVWEWEETASLKGSEPFRAFGDPSFDCKSSTVTRFTKCLKRIVFLFVCLWKPVTSQGFVTELAKQRSKHR